VTTSPKTIARGRINGIKIQSEKNKMARLAPPLKIPQAIALSNSAGSIEAIFLYAI